MTQPTITAREQLRIDLEKAYLAVVRYAFDFGNCSTSQPADIDEAVSALRRKMDSFEKIVDEVFK